ncbi:MAG: LrgB family protein, partial [Erysipelotrichia bacterium]|nr:LrgB family protein [Erysipelotrichia bacterium]
MNFEALTNYINSTPLTWLIITLAAFKLGIIIYEKFNKHTLLQPIIIAYVIILSLIVFTNTSFEKYFKSVEIIHFFLGPAT